MCRWFGRLVLYPSFQEPDSFKFRKEMFVQYSVHIIWLFGLRLYQPKLRKGERRPFRCAPSCAPPCLQVQHKLSPNKVKDDHQKTTLCLWPCIIFGFNFLLPFDPITQLCGVDMVSWMNVLFSPQLVTVDINSRTYVHTYGISNNHMKTQLIRL